MRALYFLVVSLLCLPLEGRIQVRETGSSTVYPFALRVAKEFCQNATNVCPLVESTGTTEGFLDFAKPDNLLGYDVANASRQIKPNELSACKQAGIGDILEICIGLDGAALVAYKSIKGFEALQLNDIFLAIAENIPAKDKGVVANHYKYWNDINPKLPNLPIRVLIPSKKHGTRDVFETLVMNNNAAAGVRIGPEVREITDYEAADGHDLLFDYLEKHHDVMALVAVNLVNSRLGHIKTLAINALEPTYGNIQNNTYPLARRLYIYVKEQGFQTTESLRDYLNEWLSDKAIGKDGYLTKMGLVPLPNNIQKQKRL